MKHLFSSGETMYKKNQKELPEGLFLGESLEYEDVQPDTYFVCNGELNGKQAKIRFKISEEDYGSVKNRYDFRILMQSDILQANWESYEIIG